LSYLKSESKLQAGPDGVHPAASYPEDCWKLSGGDMLYWAAVFLVIALVAAFLGFAGVATAAAGIAKILFYLFLIIFLVTLIMGVGHRGRV
jgi:uncharacterized membrane protein YtjA (UPF0391 family)